ncbi:venom carboxylesterase-6-like [Schistocerca piceifrons]|uniref:venom carboxylesterase-6-like n=1 Tax=Schistocerca piceifrons TaxID=274613 RepID=UPI001F5E8DB0|nr:venom carboxylesterase-6-like [Schistocerca piceifrons]
MLSLLLCLLVATPWTPASGVATAEERPVVRVEQGALRGVSLRSASGRPFYGFRGVPYARPPVGKRRFKEPEPPKPWPGVWDATHYGSPCIQYVFVHSSSDSPVVGEEDCLHLNIFTPKLPTPNGVSPLLDVFVFIHGGGFMSGSGRYFGPDYLLDHEVIVVTINYRLGILGFLSTEDEQLPGNNGLKDQSMAFRWIQANIASFGGNPASITIAGSSAGAASVHFHYLSSWSRGLFQRGMSFSGSALVPWAIAEGQREKADKLASLVGCKTHSSKEILECLRTRPARQLVEMTQHFQMWRYNPFTPFGPTVETAGSTPFLAKQPAELMAEGSIQDLPWVTSVTTEEGVYPAGDFVTNEDLMEELNRHFVELSPFLLDYNYTAPQTLHQKIGIEVLQFYVGEQPLSTNTADEIVQLFSDRMFVVDVERAARMQAAVNTAPVYFYVFSYRGKHSFSEIMSGNDVDLGVSHVDDMGYIMRMDEKHGLKVLEAEEDRKVVELMVDITLHFVNSGDPASKKRNITWPAVRGNAKDINYLQISGYSDIAAATSYDLGNREFWDSLGILEPQMLIKKEHKIDEL